MEHSKSWLVIFLIFSFLLSSMAYISSRHDVEALNDFIFDMYANESVVARHNTGTVFNIPVPSNFSGLHISAVRLRSGTLWARGVDISSLHIPQRVVTMPYAKRLAIVYENLGNLSSHYYKLNDYTLVAPVIGFTVYDASNITEVSSEELKFMIMEDPILISFPNIVLKDKNMKPRCVKFGHNKSVEFCNMAEPNVCVAQGSGHFSIVVPSPLAPGPPKKEGKKKDKKWKLWVIGFVGGFVGLVVLVLGGFIVFMIIKKKKMRIMEREAEKGEAFDTTWIGKSKMPSASMMRTQPALEHDYIP